MKKNSRSNLLSFIFFVFLIVFSQLTQAAPYELTVYSDDLPSRGEAELEILSSLAKINTDEFGIRGNVIQNLIEYNYGLSNELSVGIELPNSIYQHQSKLQGFKAEIQFVPIHDKKSGWYYGIRADYGYESSVYENNGAHGFDINPIIGFRSNAWHFVFNPSIEKQLDSENKKTIFIPAAKMLFGLSGENKIGLEFYGVMGALGSFSPRSQREENLYAVIEKNFSEVKINFGVGKPLHLYEATADAWIAKMALSFEID
jgi:hypothetical protein